MTRDELMAKVAALDGPPELVEAGKALVAKMPEALPDGLDGPHVYTHDFYVSWRRPIPHTERKALISFRIDEGSKSGVFVTFAPERLVNPDVIAWQIGVGTRAVDLSREDAAATIASLFTAYAAS